MPNTHRTLDGSWAECIEGETCPLLFHLELSPQEESVLPIHVILGLLSIIDPPDEIEEDGTQVWYENDFWGSKHRDYDLPAVVYADGGMEWWQHGEPHRDHDRPALISSTGVRQWWQHNKLHREDDLPAVIWPNGQTACYTRGAYIKSATPASLKRN